MKNKILVLAPHTDDGEIGCGGSIARFIDEGKEIYYIAFSKCEESVPNGFPKNILEEEVKQATAELGIKSSNLFIKNYPVRRFNSYRQEILDDLINIKNKIKPDIVFLPCSLDTHQDHKVIFLEGQRAFKDTCILGYEFMWNCYSFNSTLFIKLEIDHIKKKISSINKYKSQKNRFYTSRKLINGQANYRGLQISRDYAEAFEVIRWII